MKFSKIGDSLYIKGRIGWKGLKKSEYLTDGEYRIINATSIVEGQIDWSDAGFISKERYDESPEIMLQNNDILISKDGTIGKVGLVSNLSKPATVASGVFVVRNLNHDKWNTKYLYYYFMSIYFKNFIESRKEGSVIPHLYQRDFEQLNIPEYSITIQNKIVDILDSITNKIRVNQQINDNLLEILSTHFIKYIVSNQTKIPDGWKIFKLKDLSDVQNGFAFKSSEYIDHSELPIIRTKNFNENSLVETNDLKYISNSSKDKYKNFRFQSLDTVMVMVGASIGKTALITTRNLPGLQNQNMWRFRSKLSEYPEMLIFELVNYINTQVGGSATGSAREFYRKTIFQEFEIALPRNSEELDIYSSIGKKIDSLASETQRLTELRDALLPKLLNGEISLSN